MAITSESIDMATRSDARARLLSELASGPARKGYGIAYDLLGNRAEAEEAVQEALARACESIGDLRDPDAAPAWFLRIVTTMCLRMLRRRRLKRTLLGWLPTQRRARTRCGADARDAGARRHRRAHAHDAGGSAARAARARGRARRAVPATRRALDATSAPRSCSVTATICRSARSPRCSASSLPPPRRISYAASRSCAI